VLDARLSLECEQEALGHLGGVGQSPRAPDQLPGDVLPTAGQITPPLSLQPSVLSLHSGFLCLLKLLAPWHIEGLIFPPIYSTQSLELFGT
jgi:hypothetical protein